MQRNLLLMAVLAVNAGIGPVWADAVDQEDSGDMIMLDSMTVTATMTNKSIEAAPAFSTIVTSEEIMAAPVNSLSDVLKDFVGVNNQTGSNGQDEIQIRGLDGRYTLILVNGKRVSSTGALWRGSDFDYNSIPLASIERVEIVRGPMAALYGSDAIGGVVNIITKQPSNEWQSSVSADYRMVMDGDEGAQHRLAASTRGAITDRIGLSLATEYYDRDAWYSGNKDDITRPARLEGKESRSVTATLTSQLDDNQTLDLDLTWNKDERPYNQFSYTYYPAWDYTSIGYSSQDIDRFSWALTHRTTFEKFTSTMFVKRESADINDYSSFYDDPQHRSMKEENTYASYYINYLYDGGSLTSGVDFRNQEIKDATTYLETGSVFTSQVAAFAQAEIELGRYATLTLGGREDDHEIYGSHFSPKVYLAVEPTDYLVVKGGVSRAFKAPDAYQLSPEYSVISCGGSCYLSGNPDLDAETSTNYEFGVEYSGKQVDVSAAYFFNDISDMINAYYWVDTDSDGNETPHREWMNAEEAETSGIELTVDYRFAANLRLSANLSTLDTEYKDASGVRSKLDFRPEQQGTIKVDYEPVERLGLSAAVNYVGVQYYDGESINAYSTIDLGVTSGFRSGLTLKAGIKNLTDVDLEEDNPGMTLDTYILARNLYMGAAYNF